MYFTRLINLVVEITGWSGNVQSFSGNISCTYYRALSKDKWYDDVLII